MASNITDLVTRVRNSIPGIRDTAHLAAALRTRLAEIDREVESLETLPAAVEDVIDLYTRASTEARFVAHIRAHYFNASTASSASATTLATHTGAHLTGIAPTAPAQPSLISAPADSQPVAASWAVEAILGDLYKSRVAELIRKALPQGYVGVSLAERKARAAKLGTERAKIEGQVVALESELAALGLVAAAPTKTGSDADNAAARERANVAVNSRELAQAFVDSNLDAIINKSPTQAVDDVEAALLAGTDPHEALSATGAK